MINLLDILEKICHNINTWLKSRLYKDTKTNPKKALELAKIKSKNRLDKPIIEHFSPLWLLTFAAKSANIVRLRAQSRLAGLGRQQEIF